MVEHAFLSALTSADMRLWFVCVRRNSTSCPFAVSFFLLLGLLPIACSRPLPPATADNYFSWGIAHQIRGDFAGAINLFTKAIELRKDFAAAYYRRANAKHSLRDLVGAIADYDKTIRIAPSFLMAYLGRGSAKQAQSDFDGALADYNKVISISPQFGAAYVSRGSLKRERKDLRGAIEDYTKAVEYSPQFDQAFIRRAGANRLLKAFPAALADYEEAIRLQNKWIESEHTNELHKVFVLNFSGALNSYKHEQQLIKSRANLYFWEGITKMDVGDYDEAQTDLTKVIKVIRGWPVRM